VLKKCVLSSFLNMAGLAAARMSGGSEFDAAGPACEKARSPNLVRSRGVTYLLLEADRRPVRVAALLDVRTMSLRYARHLPVCRSIHDRTSASIVSIFSVTKFGDQMEDVIPIKTVFYHPSIEKFFKSINKLNLMLHWLVIK